MVSASRSRVAGGFLLCLAVILSAVSPVQARGLYGSPYHGDFGPFGHPNRYGYDFRFEPAPGYPIAPLHVPFAYSPRVDLYPLYPPAAYLPPAMSR